MDGRRFDTGQVLAMGILNKQAPQSNLPVGATLQDVDEDDLSLDTLQRGLISGGLEAAMYYGAWRIWKTSDTTYAGELMQYRSVTDTFADLNIDDALEKAVYWAAICYGEGKL